jgi:predicted RNase H-like nuclease (RuvC/YqgF family)
MTKKKEKTLQQLKEQNKNQSAIIRANDVSIEALKEKLSEYRCEMQTLQAKSETFKERNRFLSIKLEGSIDKDFCLEVIKAAKFELNTN